MGRRGALRRRPGGSGVGSLTNGGLRPSVPPSCNDPLLDSHVGAERDGAIHWGYVYIDRFVEALVRVVYVLLEFPPQIAFV